MNERVSSGSERLDGVLGGGLPANSINLVMGHPGAGKTILAQQYAFRNGTRDRPAIYLSTVSEPMEKLVRYGQTLSFFDVKAVGSKVFYEDLGAGLNEGGLPRVVEMVTALVGKRRPGIVVIDSFKALRAYGQEDSDFRRFLHELAGRLSAFPTLSLWVGEYGEGEVASAPEFAVADGVLSLAAERTVEREMRFFQVLKLRGSGFLSGRHLYRLSRDGIDVFPRLADPTERNMGSLEETRLSSGIDVLDAMLGEGYWAGASTLVAGPTGSGKTIMGLHFLFKGAHQGQSGVFATMQESPSQLDRMLAGFGWSLEDEGVQVMYRSPVDLYLDEWVYELLDAAERAKARRIVIDGLGDLRQASPDRVRFREFLYSLLQRLAHQGISLMMTWEVPELFEVRQLSGEQVSYLADNVVVLHYHQSGSRLLRGLTVLKTRASPHEAEVREFQITPEGIIVGDLLARDGTDG